MPMNDGQELSGSRHSARWMSRLGPDGRLLSLDVLRAIAALGVFFFHAALATGFDKFLLPVSIPGLSTFQIPNFLSLGASGVSLFFVISGYCITRSWFLRNQTPEWSSYYRRRVTRIYPAYLVSLVVSAGITLVVFGVDALVSPYQTGRYPVSIDLIVHALFLQGFSSGSFLSLNGALWSMSTEVQFYVALPLIYMLVRKRDPQRVALVALALCLGIRGLIELSDQLAMPVEGGVSKAVLLNYSLVGRFFEFALGLVIASWESRKGGLPRMKLWAVVGLLVLAALVLWRGGGWAVDPLWGLAFAAVVILAREKLDCPGSVPFALRSLQFVGIHSYSFFLVHMPVLALISHILPLQVTWQGFIVLALLGFIVSMAVAWLMYRHIESRNWDALVAFLSPSKRKGLEDDV